MAAALPCLKSLPFSLSDMPLYVPNCQLALEQPRSNPSSISSMGSSSLQLAAAEPKEASYQEQLQKTLLPNLDTILILESGFVFPFSTFVLLN